MRGLREILDVSGVREREAWYAGLSRTNLLVVRLRDKIEAQRGRIARFEGSDEDLVALVDFLHVLEGLLRSTLERRRVLLLTLRGFALPPRTEAELDSVAEHGDWDELPRLQRATRPIAPMVEDETARRLAAE